MDFDDGVLIITDSISVNATVVAWAIQHFSVGLEDLRIITQASLLEGNLNFKSSSLSTIISISEKPGFHTQLWLFELANVLKPGGYVYLQEPSLFQPTQEYVLHETRACLERNLLFTGFHLIEEFECLDHTAKINDTTQDFELVAIKAKRLYDAGPFSAIQKTRVRKAEDPTSPIGGSLQSPTEEMDDFIDENSLLTEEDLKRPESPQDDTFVIRERIRERNRLYQRRRRARMTQDQKKREKEKRRQYMQSRRVQPVSCEMSLPIPLSCAAEECEQGLLFSQQLQGSLMIDIENNQVVGATEAL